MMAAETTATKEMATIAEPIIFDKFQNGDDEDDKSSDEESFHLPIDDEEAEKRDIILNGKGETEDDILDKFDSAEGTPDEDFEEDRLLDEAEDVVNGKVNDFSEMNGTTNGDSESDKLDNEQNGGEEIGEDTSEIEKTLTNEENVEDVEEQNETEKTESQINGEEREFEEEEEDVEMADVGEVKTEEIDIKDVDVNLEEALLNGVEEEEDVDLEKIKDEEELIEAKLDAEVEEEATHTADVDEEPQNIDETLDTVDQENQEEDTVNKDEEEAANKDEEEEEEIVNQDEEVISQEDQEIVDKEEETVNNEDDTSKLVDDVPEIFEDEEMMEDTPDLVEDIQKLVNSPDLAEDTAKTKEDTTNIEEDTTKTNEETTNSQEETTNLEEITSKTDESITIIDEEELNKGSEEPTKDKSEENSNHSGKSNDQDTDDLLNVSIIRGVEEDDENAREELTKEKELQDAEEESCDKVSVSDSADNEPKDDSRMDFEDDDSKQTEDETTVIEKGDDTLTEKDEDAPKIDDEESKGSESKDDDKHCDSGKENENPEDDEDDDLDNEGGDFEAEAGEDSSKEGSIKSGKRSLSGVEDDVASKKRKLADETAVKAPETPAEPVKENPKILTSFATFMKNKKLKNKLTRADLEQFCLQKICESILHKTDVGELHQKLKNYESTIDSLRKDVSQLTKQARDLEIVNKKLMNELKLQNGNKKPMVPLKITRSVGLQVKLNVSVAENLRRRPGAPMQMPKQVQTPVTTPNNRPAIRSNAPATRQMPQQKTPILNQALQNRRAAQQSPTTPQKRPNYSTIRPKGAGVIDLTDEDDRAKAKQTPKTVSLSPMKTVTVSQNKTINVGGNKTITVNQTKTIPLTQQKPGTPNRTMATGVRLTPTQLKNGSIAIPASVVGSSSPQLMYVVQPTSTLASGGLMSTGTGPQKAVLVNFQPTNGVLTSSLNGSAVSVIPKGGLQLKTMNTRKHPAPLPAPPVVRINADGPVKPLPPKPHLSIRKTENGIILQWKMPYNLDHYETIASYQLYAYQETNAPPSTDMWRRVGDVKALALPMACTLTQFADKNKYYFAVRSVDIYKRIGAFSDPEEISL